MSSSITDRILYLLYGIIAAGIIVCLVLDAGHSAGAYAAGRDVVTTSVTAGHDRHRAGLSNPRLGVANNRHNPPTPAGSSSDRT